MIILDNTVLGQILKFKLGTRKHPLETTKSSLLVYLLENTTGNIIIEDECISKVKCKRNIHSGCRKVVGFSAMEILASV